jgi:hypothetical protein
VAFCVVCTLDPIYNICVVPLKYTEGDPLNEAFDKTGGLFPENVVAFELPETLLYHIGIVVASAKTLPFANGSFASNQIIQLLILVGSNGV